MTDFTFYQHVLRGDMVEALTENPEQTVWVLGEIAGRMDTRDLVEHIDNVEDEDVLVAFLEELAEQIRADMEARND